MELWKLSAAETALGIRNRRFTARAATESVLARLSAVNPALNAVVAEMPEEALEAADAVDAKIAKGMDPGILCGVPVTVKVNVDQQGHATTNGLRIQKDLIAKTDSPVVANLRKAGAIIIGRTNTPAFSTRWFTRNDLHGGTRNPRDAGLTPGGSSGGAASAVAAGIGAIGHGTDIAGSIRYPAYACGVHGLRPTFGRIPAVNFTAPDRHIGAQIMAVSGPIARTVDDLRLGFEAMSQPDLRDSWYVPDPGEKPRLQKKAVLTVAPEGLAVDPSVQDALRDAAGRLSDAGWQVEERPCPPLREMMAIQLILWLADFRRSALDAMAREGNEDALFIFDQLVRHAGCEGFEPLMDALQARYRLVREWQMFLADTPLVLLPVSAEPPFPDQLDVQSPDAFDRVAEAQLVQIALPLAGIPAMTVSTRMAGTAPIGVQIAAPRYREDILFEAGRILEAGGTPPSPIDPAG
ncbi:MAG: amidase family protein [Alphaproteobacteria bacterium]|nr:amidase family protein [Alphaproteobacteria bacterium]